MVTINRYNAITDLNGSFVTRVVSEIAEFLVVTLRRIGYIYTFRIDDQLLRDCATKYAVWQHPAVWRVAMYVCCAWQTLKDNRQNLRKIVTVLKCSTPRPVAKEARGHAPRYGPEYTYKFSDTV